MLHLPRRDREKCSGKIRYTTVGKANSENKRITMGAEYHGRHYEKLKPYFCTNCKGWHLGHPVRTKRQVHDGINRAKPYKRIKTKVLDNIYN